MAFAYLNHEHAHQRIAYQKAPLKDENFRISIANHLNTCILGFGLYFSQEPWNRAVIVYGETDFSWDKSINFPFVAPQSATLHNPPRASNGYFNLHVGLNVYCHAWSLTEYCRSAFEQLIGSRLVHR
jgi:hypothetical protein